VNKLMGISDLDINTAQAWQLVHLLAKELELDLHKGNHASEISSSADALPAPRSCGNLAPPPSTVVAPPTVAYLGGTPNSVMKPGSGPSLFGNSRTVSRSGALVVPKPGQPLGLGSPRVPSTERPEVQPGSPRRGKGSPKLGNDRGLSMAQVPSSEPPRRWTATQEPSQPSRRTWNAPDPAQEGQRRGWTSDERHRGVTPPKPSENQGAEFQKPLRLEPHEEINMDDLTQGECLGTGGFGAVYRGTFKGAEVAIKKLFCEDAANLSPSQLDELGKEVAALKNLRHERLVSFIGASLQPPNLCIVTEFMSGGSLHQLLHKAKTALSLSQQAKMALQVAEGVSFLHSLTPPVVHRDLKSLNIVLDKQYNAKICDFGLTQSMDKTHISLKEGGNGGSPRYMAPECYDNKGKITEKVDVWATGCILIEIFGGPLPYDDCNNMQQIVAKVLIEKMCPHIPYHLPRGVRSIVEDCFHFDLTQRTSAPEVYSRLRSIRF